MLSLFCRFYELTMITLFLGSWHSLYVTDNFVEHNMLFIRHKWSISCCLFFPDTCIMNPQWLNWPLRVGVRYTLPAHLLSLNRGYVIIPCSKNHMSRSHSNMLCSHIRLPRYLLKKMFRFHSNIPWSRSNMSRYRSNMSGSCGNMPWYRKKYVVILKWCINDRLRSLNNIKRDLERIVFAYFKTYQLCILVVF